MQVTSAQNVAEVIEPDRWLELYGDYLFRFAFLRLKEREAAEDAVQETLLSAHKSLQQFQGRSSMKTWLVSILKNKIIDHLRKVTREGLTYYEDLGGDRVVDESFTKFGIWRKFFGAWEESPEALLERKDFMQRVVQCLHGLPDNLRNVFTLRVMEDVTTEDICERLEITPNNLWVIFYRARMRLRQCLEQTWFDKKGVNS